jgi:cytochrome c-type biogenesis protein CcmH/NrfG
LRNTYAPWDKRVQTLRRTLTESIPASRSREKSSVLASTVDELHALGYLGPTDALSSTDVPEPSLLPDPKDKIEEQNLLHIAMMSSEDSRLPEARVALKKLLAMDSISVTALTQLGRLETTSGNASEAAGYFRQAHKLRPQDPTIALEYSESLQRIGDLQGAREVLEMSLESHPNQFSAHLQLGRIYFQSNDVKSALVEFESAQLIEPDNMEVTVDLAKTLIAQGNLTDAVELLGQVINSPAIKPEAAQLLATACAKLSRKTGATGADLRAMALCKSKKSS